MKNKIKFADLEGLVKFGVVGGVIALIGLISTLLMQVAGL